MSRVAVIVASWLLILAQGGLALGSSCQVATTPICSCCCCDGQHSADPNATPACDCLAEDPTPDSLPEESPPAMPATERSALLLCLWQRAIDLAAPQDRSPLPCTSLVAPRATAVPVYLANCTFLI